MGNIVSDFAHGATDLFGLTNYGGKAQGEQEAAMIAAAQAEEARKAALRERINRLYGIGPETEQVQVGLTPPPARPGGGFAALTRGLGKPIYETRGTGVPEALAGFAGEESDLSGALRGYYGDEGKKSYAAAERAIRFGAANTGNLGSSYADALAELEEKNRLGGTRTEEAVQRALNSLRASREQFRLSGLSLVNAGQGEEGIRSATAGLRSSLEAAKAANREDLFTDLFSSFAAGKQVTDERSREARWLASFKSGQTAGGLGTPSRGSGATVIPTFN